MHCNGFYVDVIKTTKVDIDENAHNLPPHRGKFPEYKVADFFCPEDWSNDGVFIPVEEGEPFWLDFRRNADECAILCAIQRVNPVTGLPVNLDVGLSKDPKQNYLRMPEQKWLDGYLKDGKVYQFVVTKAGIGLAVNEYVLPLHMQDSHALGFAFYAPKNPKPRPSPTRDIHHYYKHTFLPEKTWYSSAIDYHSVMGGGVAKGMSGGMCVGSAGGSAACDSSDDADYGVLLASSSPVTHMSANVNRSASSLKTASLNCVADHKTVDSIRDIQIETNDLVADGDEIPEQIAQASIGMGGRIVQSVWTDENTTEYYNKDRSALLPIYFALPSMFKSIMKKGRRDVITPDTYKMSGEIAGIPVPLI